MRKELDGRGWEEELTGDSRHIYEDPCWMIFFTAPTGIINPVIVPDVFRANWEHTDVFPFVAHSRNSPLQWRSFKKPQLTPIARQIDSEKPADSFPSSTASVTVDLPREANLSVMDGNVVEVLHSSGSLEKPAWTRKLISRGANSFKYMQDEQI